jgi:hypothetical protein
MSEIDINSPDCDIQELLREFLKWNEKNIISKAYDYTTWFSIAQVSSWLDVVCGLTKVDPFKNWDSIFITLRHAEELVDVWLCCDLITSRKTSSGIILFTEKKNALSTV